MKCSIRLLCFDVVSMYLFSKFSDRGPSSPRNFNSYWLIFCVGGSELNDTEHGWHSFESGCLPPMCPGFDSRTRRHMWAEFVVGSLLCSERFFPRYSGFSPLLKNRRFQIPIRSWNARAFLNEFLWTPWCFVGKQITYIQRHSRETKSKQRDLSISFPGLLNHCPARVFPRLTQIACFCLEF